MQSVCVRVGCVDTKRVLKVPSCVLCTHMFAAHSGWRHVEQKELRMDAFLDMPQAGELGSGRRGERGGKAQRGNCEILRAFYYNYCYAYAMWHEQQRQQRQHSPLRVINRLTIIHPGQQNKTKGEKEFQDVPGGARWQARGGEQRSVRQGEAIKAQDLKYFPSGGPFGGAAGHAYHQ